MSNIEHPIEYPKVSCLTVTRNRVKQLHIVINCFLEQTYPNKELIIVYEDDDDATCKFASDFKGEGKGNGKGDIRFFCVPVEPIKQTLGWLRNYSVSVAEGVFVMQWDDDDWFHCRRIGVMYESLIRSGKLACFLNQWIIWDKTDGKAYLSVTRMWEGSILTYKSVVQKLGGYGMKKRGEDTCLIMKLMRLGGCAVISNPQLYIYVIHGDNTWHREHFNEFIDNKLRLKDNSGCEKLIRKIVDGDIDCAIGSKKIDDLFTANNHL